MRIEMCENTAWAFCCWCVGVVLLALVLMCWFAIERYDKRINKAIEAGYTIDHSESASYKPSPK